MRAYNFQRQFAAKILDGSKPHTIRARRKDGYLPIPGEVIRLYTGMRTKQCELLREVEVLRVTPITITQEGDWYRRVRLNTVPMTSKEVDVLALADGFTSTAAFFDFFREKHGEEFNGYLIEWKP